MPLPPTADTAGESAPKRQTLKQRVVYIINHSSPAECVWQICTSHVTYRILGACLISAAVVAAAAAPSASPEPELALPAQAQTAANPLGGAGGVQSSEGQTSTAVATPAQGGRALFVGSTFFAALSSVHKRRCLYRHPTDQLVLNTCLAGLQLFVGLVLGPALLLLLHSQSVRETLLQLARGLRCCLSGFNSFICREASDAFGVRSDPYRIERHQTPYPLHSTACCVSAPPFALDLAPPSSQPPLTSLLLPLWMQADAHAPELLYFIERMECGIVWPAARRRRDAACGRLGVALAHDAPSFHPTGLVAVFLGGSAAESQRP